MRVAKAEKIRGPEKVSPASLRERNPQRRNRSLNRKVRRPSPGQSSRGPGLRICQGRKSETGQADEPGKPAHVAKPQPVKQAPAIRATAVRVKAKTVSSHSGLCFRVRGWSTTRPRNASSPLFRGELRKILDNFSLLTYLCRKNWRYSTNVTAANLQNKLASIITAMETDLHSDIHW
jgi:hypothetical protein